MSDEPLWRRYRDLLRRRPADDVADEVRHHLSMREEEAVRSGIDPARARADARTRFGDVDGVVAELNAIDGSRERRRRRTEWLSDVRQDTRFAFRSLRRAPTFALAAISTMALAIAANTTIFSFVNALLLQPLPYARPQELVAINANMVASIGELLALRERHVGLAEVSMIRPRSVTFSDDRDATRLDGYFVTTNLTSMLGVSPEVGHPFDAGMSRPGADHAILLSHGLWMERYGGDPRVVGRSVDVDGIPYVVVGVMPASFAFPSTGARFWTPLTIDPSNAPQTWAIGSAGWIARLARGETIEHAASALASTLPGFRRLNPMWDPGAGYARTLKVTALQRSLVGSERTPLILLFACVVVVLAVACVNLANLMLARVTAREREFVVRAALGGGRGRLIRQLLTESILIAAIGSCVGVAFATGAVRWAKTALPLGTAHAADVHVDGTVLAFTALLAVVTGVMFGLVPAIRAGSASPSTDAAHLTRGGVTHGRLTSALVACEVALSVVLAITAGLLTRSFAHLNDLSPGFRSDRIVTARISPPAAAYNERARTSGFYAEVLRRVASMPGVTDAGLVDRLPIAAPIYGLGGMRVRGQFEDIQHGLPSADHMQATTPGYFRVLGIPTVQGRDLTTQDVTGGPPVALVSRALAHRFWPNGDAVGKQIGYPWPSPWITIVGVVPDVRLDSLRDTTAIAVYVPFEQRTDNASPEMSIVIRTTLDADVVGREVKQIVASIDRSVPVTSVRTMNEVISRSVAKPRFTTLIVAAFAIATLLLGAVGIYGVMSYVVNQRMHELGVRIALGATATDLARHVLGRAAALAGVGAVIGCALALISTRGLRSLLYGVTATDPATFVVSTLGLVSVAVAASLVPARRATRADPVEVLRG